MWLYWIGFIVGAIECSVAMLIGYRIGRRSALLSPPPAVVRPRQVTPAPLNQGGPVKHRNLAARKRAIEEPLRRRMEQMFGDSIDGKVQ